jgi:hypothetical protein
MPRVVDSSFAASKLSSNSFASLLLSTLAFCSTPSCDSFSICFWRLSRGPTTTFSERLSRVPWSELPCLIRSFSADTPVTERSENVLPKRKISELKHASARKSRSKQLVHSHVERRFLVEPKNIPVPSFRSKFYVMELNNRFIESFGNHLCWVCNTKMFHTVESSPIEHCFPFVLRSHGKQYSMESLADTC